MKAKIKGGYYIKARRIRESSIATQPPHVREIWDWLLMECNHESNKTCERGQCVRSYKDIQDGLSWYVGWRKMSYNKWQCENAMKWLKRTAMITTMKTTRGLIITVLNYDYFQNPANYESHERTTREPQTTDTINKNDKNDKNDKNTIYSHNSNEFRLASLLYLSIKERKNDFKHPNLQKWCVYVKRMIQTDNRNPDIIAKVIKWCQQDDFWQNNILSTDKLKKQFDALELKMNKMPNEKKRRTVGEVFKDE